MPRATIEPMATADAIENLRKVRETLVAERDVLRRRLKEFDELVLQADRMVQVLLDSQPQPDLFHPSPVRDTPTIRESVLQVLSDGEPHHFNAFLRQLGHQGPPPKDASVRGVVSRMKRDGEIVSLGQGKYQIAAAEPLTAPVAPESSAAPQAHHAPEADAGSTPAIQPAQ